MSKTELFEWRPWAEVINCQSKMKRGKDKYDEAAAVGQIEESTF